MALLVLSAVAAGWGLVACGNDDAPDALGGRETPAVDQIEVAVEELERLLGGSQDYFEINAGERFVNLFVATDDRTTVTPYLFADGAVQAPAPTRPVAEGATFTADDIVFDPDRVLHRVADELPDAILTTFVIVVGPDDRLRYEVLARSARGGTLAVEVTPDGEVVGVESL